MSESSKGGPRALTPEELTWCCEGIRLEFETTEDLEPLTGTIGQERALKALSLGLNLYAPGYNMFVCGLSGTRKMETVQEILEHLEPRSALPPDRAYVHNFRSPDQPVLLTFPRGKARRFAFEMDRLVEDLKVALSGLTREESLARRRQKVIKQYEEKGTELFKPFEEKARDSGFGIVQVASPGGVRPTLVPIWEDKPTQWSELEEKVAEGEFSAEDLESKRERFGDLHLEMEQLVARSMGLGRDLRQELRELTRGLAWEIVKEHVGGLREEWGEGPEGKIGRYLDQAEMAVVEDLEIFIQGEKDEKPGGPVAENTHQHIGTADEDPFVEYRVKVVLDAEKMGECPIITEQTPTHQNIFGTVEYVGEKGATTTNHTRIKAGDILEADGGYLVLDAYDAIMEPGVWTDLKRTLLHQKLQLQPVWPGGVSFVTRRLKPEPIPIATKVLMVGDRYLYNTLMTLDDDFLRAFKVLVDFDDEVDLTDESIGLMARFVARIVREEGLAHFTRGGVAAVVTRAVRETGDRSKMSARLNIIADLMREADHLRAIAKDTAVEESHILEALEGIEFRHNLIEEKIQEAIQKDVVLIDSSGDRVGVLNGLSVYDLGNYRFGRPTRISAAVSLGRGGIVNIEREADLSGSTHDKGVLILSGFLRDRYAQEKPLSLEASLAFEQSYGMVDGDSASSTELYALMSALSGLALRQDIAVTGSVNQKGEVQAIGGVNEKIEGFFEVCKERGLTGTQGVMIPESNVQHLALKVEVAQAVRDRKFHVWAVAHVDEGISLLTGKPAGEPTEDGTWTEDSVNALVAGRLDEMAEEIRAYMPDGHDGCDGGDGDDGGGD